jgi:transcriptional regulator GlxA family with amidase domain
MSPRRVVILVFPGFQLLDLSGPGSVFASASQVAGARGYVVETASATGGLIASSAGVSVASSAAASIDPFAVDLLLISGGDRDGLLTLIRNEDLADWTRNVAAHAARHGSVCTGAFALSAWGLCNGRRVATHWAAAGALQRAYRSTRVDPAPLWVEDGSLWTSAGVTSGIDMALAMVARDEGEACAAAVARRLVLPLRRQGNQAQHSRILEAQSGADGRYAELIGWIAQNLDRRLAAPELAARAGQAERSFQRGFSRSAGLTPAAFVARLRLEHARELLSAGHSVKEAARSCGYAGADRLSRAFSRAYGAPPTSAR